MKQNITIDQGNELSEKAKTRLREWMVEHKYNIDQVTSPTPSIGQLIEFLDEHGNTNYFLEGHAVLGHYGEGRNPELADTLWENVKKILEKES